MCVPGLESRIAASRRPKWRQYPSIRATAHVACVNVQVKEICALLGCYFRIDVSEQPVGPYMLKVRLSRNVGNKLPPLVALYPEERSSHIRGQFQFSCGVCVCNGLVFACHCVLSFRE